MYVYIESRSILSLIYILTYVHSFHEHCTCANLIVKYFLFIQYCVQALEHYKVHLDRYEIRGCCALAEICRQ